MSGDAVGSGVGFTFASDAGRENFFFFDISMILIEERMKARPEAGWEEGEEEEEEEEEGRERERKREEAELEGERQEDVREGIMRAMGTEKKGLAQ